MEMKTGLLFINDVDVCQSYGVFLTEDQENGYTNYDELMKPSPVKSYTEISFPEQDGVKLPAALSPKLEARDFTLYFALVADNRSQFYTRYSSFLSLLRSGWLTIRVPELDRTYKVYYKECSGYNQLVSLSESSGEVGTRFKVKFREPSPTI